MSTKQSALAATMLVLIAFVQIPAFAAPGSAAGHKHAAKANRLAEQNRCKAAVAEFTKAYRLLKDPALLFDRAECYQKIGKDSQALKDYEKYLAKMPTAPNRSIVEDRIASLRGEAQTAGPSEKGSRAKPGTAEATPAEPPAEKWADSDTAPVGEEGAAGAGSTAIGTAVHKAPEPQAAADLAAQPVVPEVKQAGRSHAWIWIGTAVVVVGAGAFAAYHYWPRPKTDVPQTPLGNYAF
jgi:tetratricopeptide (TPR) repeat protein